MRDSDWLKIKLRLIFLIYVQTQILCNGAMTYLISYIFAFRNSCALIRIKSESTYRVAFWEMDREVRFRAACNFAIHIGTSQCSHQVVMVCIKFE